jgi:hypothetical protein
MGRGPLRERRESGRKGKGKEDIFTLRMPWAMVKALKRKRKE